MLEFSFSEGSMPSVPNSLNIKTIKGSILSIEPFMHPRRSITGLPA